MSVLQWTLIVAGILAVLALIWLAGGRSPSGSAQEQAEEFRRRGGWGPLG